MNFQRLMAVLAFSVLALHCSHKPAVVEEPQNNTPEISQPTQPAFAWGYEGEKNPEAWASLSPEFAQCAQGKKQSPINLAWRKPSKKKQRLDFSYSSAPAMVDLASPVPTLRFNGGNQLLLNGKVYNLDRIEFHSPSEHQLSKNSLTMEIQFIHKAVSGDGMAAVSLFAIEGRDNMVLADVWAQLANPTGQGMQFDASKLLPPQKTHYFYSGSLTSPPCTEGVDWIVFNTPTELSKEQIMAYRSKFAANSRPAQPLNGRKVSNH